jgi:hypothetical protein
MEKHILSKSTFIKGHQCFKALYLHKKRPFLRDKLSAEQLAKFKRGHEVGELAQQLFPGGIDVSPQSPSQYQKSVLRTQELIEAGQKVIYEATFQFNKVLVMLDILVKTENGWQAYEVKSSRSLSQTYFTDAALQYYVIRNSGLNLASFSLVYVNENYVLDQEGALNANHYFIIQEVSEQIRAMQTEIAQEIELELQVLASDHSPKIEIGAHCFSPYPCDFQGFCWKGTRNDLSKIPAFTESERKELLSQGVFGMEDLMRREGLNPLAKKQLDCLASNTSFVNFETKTFCSTLPINTLYFSFVLRQAAIPECKGFSPYQNQIIAYSFLSEQRNETHLFSGRCDDYKAFVEKLIRPLRSASQIVVFDLIDLKITLSQAAQLFPELTSEFEKIMEKASGIKQRILQGEFYFPGFTFDLELKDVARHVSKKSVFSKQAVYSDVLAVKLFEAITKNNASLSIDSDEVESLMDYSQSKANKTRQICEALSAS